MYSTRSNISLLSASSISCVSASCVNFYSYNASFENLYVDNEFITFINSCSYLLGVNNAKIMSLNVSTITNVAKINVSVINASLITIFSLV